jgi:two-component system OmpR family response regulator
VPGAPGSLSIGLDPEDHVGKPFEFAGDPGSVLRNPQGSAQEIARIRCDALWVDRPKVLVVDDEENIRFLVGSALSVQNLDVAAVDNGTNALQHVRNEPVDVVVLDINLPDIDGFEILRRLRADGWTGSVLFLTARGATEDRVRGLTSGGDDYITKPFALEELVARVHVALRRAGKVDERELRAGDVVLDEDAHEVRVAGDSVHLTPTEFKLLRLLLSNVGRVVSRAQILDHVWEYDFDGESAIVETFISGLRRKVDIGETTLIHTVRGVGYSIKEPR